MKTFACMFAFLAIAFLFIFSSAVNAQYIVTNLGNLGGHYTYATSINDSGQIIGRSTLTDGSSRSFLWANGQMVVIGDSNFECRAINNFGQIAGNYHVPNGLTQGVIYSNGIITSLGSEFYYVNDINDVGQVVGYSSSGHALLYSNGTITNLGSAYPSSHSYANAINNRGQIVGNIGNYAYIWENSIPIQIPTTDYPSKALGINDVGQVVGYQGDISWDKQKAFIYSNGELTILNPISNYTNSRAYAINNKSEIVGYSNYWPGYFWATHWNSDGNVKLPLPAGGNAVAINNLGQIITQSWGTNWSESYLLTPVGQCHAYQVKPKADQPIDRLRKWDSKTSSWVPVSQGELSSGKIHVLVHGWGAGLRNFADAGGNIWDSSAGGYDNNQYKLLHSAATALDARTSDDHVIVAFNWLDMSATKTKLPDEAKFSRIKTDEAAGLLREALMSAGIKEGFSGRLQIFGMSHGARVSGVATVQLNDLAAQGSVIVNQLTLGDSPEKFLAGMLGANNNLDNDVLNRINIGKDGDSTFVDNYYSFFGGRYIASPDIVNVELRPNYPLWDFENNHTYPIPWYEGASLETENLAIAWSPLLGDTYQTLSSHYQQDWSRGEFALRDLVTGEPVPIVTKINLPLSTILKQGNVFESLNGVCLTENSPSYWHTSFEKGVNDVAIEFSYQFLIPGDGDELGIWIDDEMRFVIPGNLAGINNYTTSIDISDIDAGYHILSVALHSYGDANASVAVTDFTMVSVPEPSSFLLMGSGIAFFIFWYQRRRVQRPSLL